MMTKHFFFNRGRKLRQGPLLGRRSSDVEDRETEKVGGGSHAGSTLTFFPRQPSKNTPFTFSPDHSLKRNKNFVTTFTTFYHDNTQKQDVGFIWRHIH
jgi:hypothetical protein